MRVNLNDRVKVRLTEAGKAHWAATPYSYQLKEDADGYTEWQLWDLMYTFGTVLYMGTARMPFEGAAIEILPST